MAIEDRNLTVGTRLVANYRRQAHACMVEKAEEGGKLAFVLEDGKRYKSASSAASALMGGKAVNGWRFWSVQGTKPKAKEGGDLASHDSRTGAALSLAWEEAIEVEPAA